MLFSRSANAMRVGRHATRMASRTTQRRSLTALQAAFPNAMLPPHPHFVGERSLPRDAGSDFELHPHEYNIQGYTDFPDGMNAYYTPVIIYFQEIQERWDAVTELIETKDMSMIKTRWFDLFPVLVRATRDMPQFHDLAWFRDGLEYEIPYRAKEMIDAIPKARVLELLDDPDKIEDATDEEKEVVELILSMAVPDADAPLSATKQEELRKLVASDVTAQLEELQKRFPRDASKLKAGAPAPAKGVSTAAVAQATKDVMNQARQHVSMKNISGDHDDYDIDRTLIKRPQGKVTYLGKGKLHPGKASAMQNSLTEFVNSEEGIEKLKIEKEKLSGLIDEYLHETPTVLTQKQIDMLLGMSPKEQWTWMWQEYGFNLKQRSEADGVSQQDYIKSLGLSDAKTLEQYLREIKEERHMILRYQLQVPSLEADRKIQEHLDSPAANEAMDKLRAGNYSNKSEAIELLDAAIGVPKQLISDTVLKIIRQVPTNHYIDSIEKDYLRINYFSPEHGSKVADPLGLHAFYLKSTTAEDPYKWARLGFYAFLFSAATTLVITMPEHFHFIHENHELPGNRSSTFWKSQDHLKNL